MNIIKSLASTLVILLSVALLGGCSSGASESPQPESLTGFYRGAFESLNGRVTGTMILNIAENSSDNSVSGTLQFEFDPDNADTNCRINTVINGTRTGFNVSLSTGGDNLTGNLNITYQLTQQNRNLNGTYVTSGDNENCSFFSGSGNVNFIRQ